jgi:hypothetical protein
MLEVATRIELSLYPAQVTACRYLCARAPIGWLWREVAVLMARQNGKTTIGELLALTRMVTGFRVMHSAQNRELPRESHAWLGDTLAVYYPHLMGRNAVRSSSGQESIHLKNGGHYRIAAATRSGARGPSNDLVLIDEVLELDSFDFLAAAKPTLMASAEPQTVYLSNAGTPESVVLASLRLRADSDHNLAYLEWSAEADGDMADPRQWAMANPSIGHNPAVLGNLEADYQAHLLGGTLDVWERENLCRWTPSIGQSVLIALADWEKQPRDEQAERGSLGPRRCTIGIKCDPNGERASAVAAWPIEGGVALEVIADVTGSPIDYARVGPELARLAVTLRARQVVFDPWTDADLARHMRQAKALTGRDWASASEKFVQLALAKQLSVRDPARILDRDLEHTVRSSHTAGTYVAVKDMPESTNTAIEAAIRAVWLASAPQPKVVVY